MLTPLPNLNFSPFNKVTNVDFLFKQQYPDFIERNDVQDRLYDQINAYYKHGTYRSALMVILDHFDSRRCQWFLNAYDSLVSDHPGCPNCHYTITTLLINLFAIYEAYSSKQEKLELNVDPRITAAMGHIDPNFELTLVINEVTFNFTLTLREYNEFSRLITIYVNGFGYTAHPNYICQFIHDRTKVN